MVLILLCVFRLLSPSIATTPLSAKIGRTAAHGTTGYITSKVDLEPILRSAQNTLDVLDHASEVLTNDSSTLRTYSTDILQSIVNINHILKRTEPDRDNIDFVAQNPMDNEQLNRIHEAVVIPPTRGTFFPRPKVSRSFPITLRPIPTTASTSEATQTPTTTAPSRNRRTAGLLEGFVAISNLAGSIFKWFIRITHQSDLDTLKYKVNAVTHTLVTTQQKVNDALHAYNTLASKLSTLQSDVIQILALTHVLEIATHTSMILRQIYLALLELKQNRLPLDLIKPHELFIAHTTIAVDMERDNMVPVFPSDLLYEVPVEALYKPLDGLYIFIPVYAVRDNSIIDLHRFNHVPIKVTDATLMSFQLEYPYIALSPNDNQIGKVFSQDELDDCTVVRDFYHCPTKNYVRTNLTDLCVYNLLIEHKDGILDTCQVSFENERSTVYQVKGNDFVVFSANPDQLIMQCFKDDLMEATTFEYLNSVAFTLNRTCPEATTSRYRFRYQSSHHINSQILCDPLPFNESIIGQIIPSLSIPIAAALPQMGTFDLSDFDAPPHAQVYANIIVSWIKDYAFIIVSISITYVLCHTIYCCRSKTTRDPKRLTYQDQLRVALKA